RGCTSRGRCGRPGMRIGSGAGASAGIASSPRANAAACRCVSAILSSTAAAARHSRAASNSDGIAATRSEREPALALGVVGAQLLEAFEVARLDAGDVLAAEARAVELHARELRPGHGGFEVGQVLVDQ